MGNSPAGDFTRLTYIADLHDAGCSSFNLKNRDYRRTASIVKEVCHAR